MRTGVLTDMSSPGGRALASVLLEARSIRTTEPVDCRSGPPLATKPTGTDHSPPPPPLSHQKKPGFKIYGEWPCPPEQDPVFPTVSPSHQEAYTRPLSSSIRGQTEETRTMTAQPPK